MAFKGLLVTYWFPPVNSVAAKRMDAFARYLNDDANFQLDVMCPNRGGSTEDYNFLFTHQENSTVSYSSTNSEVRNFKSIVKDLIVSKTKYHQFLSLQGGVMYQSVKEGKFDFSNYDFVVCSNGPIDAFHIGLYLKRKHPKIKLVLDYRDHLTLNPMHNLGWLKGSYLKFEKSILIEADLIVGVSNKLVEKLNKTFHLKKPAQVVYNGFEPAIAKQITPKESTKPYWVHAGALYGGKRDVVPFLSHFSNQKDSANNELVFILFDEADKLYLRQIKQTFSELPIQVINDLSHEETLSYIAGAHAGLLFLAPDGSDEEYLPVKMYEYMQFDLPIIFSGNKQKSEAFQLIDEFGIGQHYKDFQYNADVSYDFSEAKKKFTRKHQVETLKKKLLEML